MIQSYFLLIRTHVPHLQNGRLTCGMNDEFMETKSGSNADMSEVVNANISLFLTNNSSSFECSIFRFSAMRVYLSRFSAMRVYLSGESPIWKIHELSFRVWTMDIKFFIYICPQVQFCMSRLALIVWYVPWGLLGFLRHSSFFHTFHIDIVTICYFPISFYGNHFRVAIHNIEHKVLFWV